MVIIISHYYAGAHYQVKKDDDSPLLLIYSYIYIYIMLWLGSFQRGRWRERKKDWAIHPTHMKATWFTTSSLSLSLCPLHFPTSDKIIIIMTLFLWHELSADLFFFLFGSSTLNRFLNYLLILFFLNLYYTINFRLLKF